jgi:hypothetical protein
MPTINVAQKFLFTHDDGKQQEFKPGAHEVSDKVAGNWFVQAHTTTPPKNPPAIGSPEYVNFARRVERLAELQEEIAALQDVDPEAVKQGMDGDTTEVHDQENYNQNTDDHPGKVARRRNLNKTL